MRVRFVTAGAVRLGLVGLLAAAAPLAVQAADDPAATCARLATHPQDPKADGPGVEYGAIDAPAAIAACEAALALRPDDGRLRYMLGRAYDKAGRPADALAAYAEAAANGFTMGLTAMALSYENGDGVPADQARANALYREAAEAGDPWAMNNLGMNYAGGFGVTRDRAEAERLYRGAIAAGNGYTVMLASNNIAYMLARAGDRLDEAERLAREAVATAAASAPGEEAANRDTLALILHKTGRNDAALEEQQRAIGALDEEKGVYFAHLGDIYAALGRNDEAKAAWTKALDLPPDEWSFDESYDLDRLRGLVGG